MAADLVTRKVDVIVALSTPTAMAAYKATRDIPIVTTTIGDPIALGLANSLARPGKNVTGLTNLGTEVNTKRLDLLRQLVPNIRRVGLLYDPANESNQVTLRQFESECRKLRMQPVGAPASGVEQVQAALKGLSEKKVQGFLVLSNRTSNSAIGNIVDFAKRQRLPAGYGNSPYVEAGGLYSYSSDFIDLNRRAAAYADKIFKGAKPGDLPIEQPTKFDLVLNLKTARALGLKVPNSILVQATKVIE